VRQAFDDDSISWVEQSEQLGTGHAVQQVMPYINDDSISLVLYGDVPLIRQSTLENLIVQAQKSGVALLSVMLDNPTGYGRISSAPKPTTTNTCEQSACACISTCSSKVLSDRTCKTFGLVEFIRVPLPAARMHLSAILLCQSLSVTQKRCRMNILLLQCRN
jgi:hypothetical protein